MANDPWEMFCGESGGGAACSCGRGEFSDAGAVDGRTVGTVCEMVEPAVWAVGFAFDTIGKPGSGEGVDVPSMADGRALDCATGSGGATVTCVGAGGTGAGAG